MLMGMGGHAEDALFDPDFLCRWAEVELSGKDLEAVRCFLDRNRGLPGREQLGQEALVRRRQVLHEDKGKTELIRQRRQEAHQGVEASCRGAYGDDREGSIGVAGSGLRCRFHRASVKELCTRVLPAMGQPHSQTTNGGGDRYGE